MAIRPCEPKGPYWGEQSPLYRSFCVWLYRDFRRPKICGWSHVYDILFKVFPETTQPSETTIRKWYEETPDYPEKLGLWGCSPQEYLEQWGTSHPREFKEIMNILLKTPSASSAGGVQPQSAQGQEPGLAPARYSRQLLPISLDQRVFHQVTRLMCQAVLLLAIAWFMRQSTEIATS
ncbi:MAG: hypothetical protein ACE5LA_04160 [Dehalococcoidales bacterium]